MRFLPLTLLAFIVAFFAGRLTVRVQSRLLLGIGMIAVTVGLLLMGTTHPDSAWTVLLPGFIVCGLGIGTVNPVLASGAISVVQPQRSGMASGANNTFRQVGIATGIAVLGAVFQSQIVAHTSAALNKTIYGHEVLHQGGAQLRGALAAGEVQQVAASIPVLAARHALLQRLPHRVLDHDQPPDGHRRRGGLRRDVLAGFILVRQSDFVVPTGGAGHRPGGGPGRGAPADAVPAAHA